MWRRTRAARCSALTCSRAASISTRRSALRVAAWRAVWGFLQNNRVYAARYRYLTSRDTNRLKPTQAQTIVAAAILRQLYAIVTTGQAWNPDIAVHGHVTQSHLEVIAA